jgi:hypothetical protein
VPQFGRVEFSDILVFGFDNLERSVLGVKDGDEVLEGEFHRVLQIDLESVVHPTRCSLSAHIEDAGCGKHPPEGLLEIIVN